MVYFTSYQLSSVRHPPETLGEPSKMFAQQLKELSLNKNDFRIVMDIHRNWYFFSLKALMVQMAKELLHSIDSASRERLKLCLKRIVYTNDVRNTAICLLKTKERWKTILRTKKLRKKSEETKAFVQAPVTSRNSTRSIPTTNAKTNAVARFAPQTVPIKRVKWKPRRRSRLRRAKRSLYRLMSSNEMNSDIEHMQVTRHKSLPFLIAPSSPSPVRRLSKLFVSLFGNATVNDLRRKWSTTYKKMRELSEALEKNEKLPGARVYSARVYDLVMDNDKNSTQEAAQIYVPPYLKKIINFVNSFEGAPVSRLLSPRIAPLIPEKRPKKGFLSPALFPFYKDDTEQQIMPVPEMLESAGLNENDREEMLNMVMEVTGTRETVDKAMAVLQNMSSSELGDKLLSVTEKIGESFEKLHGSLTISQRKEMDGRGFTFMEPDQIRRLHKEQGLDRPEVKAMLEEYATLAKEHREEALWGTIAKIAGKKHRQKRQVSILRPLVLSPFMFAPVSGLSVLGVVVLSPGIFTPVFLAPNILTPFILSPTVGVPTILSPLVLTPLILSPFGLSAAILSPTMLAPSVLSPSFLTAAILSPIALSPAILSPSIFGAAVLSPSALSPPVLSKGEHIAIVLSPSFLS